MADNREIVGRTSLIKDYRNFGLIKFRFKNPDLNTRISMLNMIKDLVNITSENKDQVLSKVTHGLMKNSVQAKYLEDIINSIVESNES